MIDEPFVPPATQTSGEVVEKMTGRPDEAVAVTVIGDWSMVVAPMVGKEMVWRTRTSRISVAVIVPTWTVTSLIPIGPNGRR